MRLPKRARRVAFDAVAAGKFLNALRSGNFEETAGQFAGLAPRTIQQWLDAGRKQKAGPLRTFFEQYHVAKCSAEVIAVANLFAETKGKFRAAETFLRLRFGDHWRVKCVEERKYEDAQRAVVEREKGVEGEVFDEGFVEEVAALMAEV